MATLNRDASRAAVALDVRCATDVTGFGLLGHLSHVVRASGVTAVVHVARVPVLDGAREAWTAGARTGGGGRNTSYLEPMVRWGTADEWQRALLTDPQTSGGLLLAVPPAQVVEYLSRVPQAVDIGEVIAADPAAGILLQ
jgi:selenide,water dikinase